MAAVNEGYVKAYGDVEMNYRDVKKTVQKETKSFGYEEALNIAGLLLLFCLL